ncbi:uncharacterized protein [Euwallacea similis]
MKEILFENVDSMGQIIYKMYIKSTGDINDTNKIIIGPKEFNYFMYIYLTLSITWLIVSCVILWTTLRDHQEKHYDQSIVAWTIVTSLVSLLDLILLFVLSHDYNKILSVESTPPMDLIILTAVGIVMTLAARGFVLWVINIVFVVILSKYSYKRYKGEVNKSPKRGNRPVIDAYSKSRPDLPWQTPYDDRKPFDNMGFKDDDDFSFSSKQNPRIRENNRNPEYVAPFTPRLGQNEPPWNKRPAPRDEVGNGLPRVYPNQEPPRTAKIGRQQDRRSPPLNVNPPYIQPLPYIPNPDYSPPGSPKVRGVLRPKSNYQLY